MNNKELQGLAESLIENFNFAGKESIRLFKEGLKIQIKEDNSPVSNGDLRVNELVTNRISNLTPNIPIISEETVDLTKKNNAKIFWLIDPIDGTKEYIAGKDEYTLNAALVINKIPVLGHIGITPQTVKGKFKSKGKTEKDKRKLIRDAQVLEEAGAFGIVLECIYSDVSKKISNLIKIPTIGIGASVNCDGQVLVTDDILGLTNSKAKFVKKYANIRKTINSAVHKFKREVRFKKYPSKKFSY